MKARFGRQILKQQRLLRDERVRNRWRDGYDVDKMRLWKGRGVKKMYPHLSGLKQELRPLQFRLQVVLERQKEIANSVSEF